MASRKQNPPDPEVIRLMNLAHPVVPGFTITNVSESDARTLSDGCVPDWMQRLAEWWCRDNPKPSDVNPEFRQAVEEERAADAVARDVA